MDLDAYRTAEVELLAREQKLSQLVDMVPSHVWRLTPDGKPTFFNKRMVDFLGLTVAGTNRPEKSRLAVMIDAALHPDDATAFRNALTSCLASGEAFAMRYRLRRADGVYRWMSSRAEPMRDHTGRILHWYGLCHDIDDQMHAEEALRASKQQLEKMIDAVPVNILSFSPRMPAVAGCPPIRPTSNGLVSLWIASSGTRIQPLMSSAASARFSARRARPEHGSIWQR